MSKAEEFIQENTRNCGNVCSYNSMECAIPWLTPDDARKAVEIEKEETIEKAAKQLRNYVNPTAGTYLFDDDIEKFRKAMRGEE